MSAARQMRWSRAISEVEFARYGGHLIRRKRHQRARRRIVARGARRAAHLGLLALGKTASRQTVHRTVCRSLTPQGEGLKRMNCRERSELRCADLGVDEKHLGYSASPTGEVAHSDRRGYRLAVLSLCALSTGTPNARKLTSGTPYHRKRSLHLPLPPQAVPTLAPSTASGPPPPMGEAKNG